MGEVGFGGNILKDGNSVELVTDAALDKLKKFIDEGPKANQTAEEFKQKFQELSLILEQLSTLYVSKTPIFSIMFITVYFSLSFFSHLC